METKEVNFILEEDDAAACLSELSTQPGPSYADYLVAAVLGVGGAVFVTVFVVMLVTGGPPVWGMLFLGLATLAGCVGKLFGRRLTALLARRQLRRGELGIELGPRRVSVSPDGLTITTPLTTATHRWEAVRRIDVTDDLVLFFFDAKTAFPVPRRAFHDDFELGGFVRVARGYHRAAWTESRP